MKRRSFFQMLLAWILSKLSIFSKPIGEQRLFHRREKGELQYAWFTKNGLKRTSEIFSDVNDALNLRYQTKDWSKIPPDRWGTVTQSDNTTKFEHSPDQGDNFPDEPPMLEWPGDLELVKFDEKGNVSNEPKWAKRTDDIALKWWERAKVRGVMFDWHPPKSLASRFKEMMARKDQID